MVEYLGAMRSKVLSMAEVIEDSSSSMSGWSKAGVAKSGWACGRGGNTDESCALRWVLLAFCRLRVVMIFGGGLGLSMLRVRWMKS